MQAITINPDRIELDEAYMQMAEIWAKRSKGNRLQVGALLVKDKRIISDGYNGMPAGDPDDVCEVWEDEDLPGESAMRTKPEVLHAESNVLMKLAKAGGEGAEGATIYTRYSPCFECAKLIKQAGIRRVVFRNLYRDHSGVDFLLKRGVVVDQLSVSAVQGGHFTPEPAPAVVRQTQPPAPTPAPPPRVSVLKQITTSPEDLAAKLRAQSVAKPVPVETPKIDDPFALPLIKPDDVPSDDEVAALLQAHAAATRPQPAASPAGPAEEKPGPYRSSFL
jgi:dCMP deaminase